MPSVPVAARPARARPESAVHSERPVDERALDAAMDRYACGDEQAFALLHRTLHPRLRAFFVRMSGSHAVADDLVQETLLRLHRARATFASGSAVVPWVYAIARNVYVDHVRAARARADVASPAPARGDTIDGRAHDGEAVAIASEAARTVERVLRALPATQREAFVLLRYEGLGIDEAAVVLGATPSAVKLRAFRAYEALRAELDLAGAGRRG